MIQNTTTIYNMYYALCDLSKSFERGLKTYVAVKFTIKRLIVSFPKPAKE